MKTLTLLIAGAIALMSADLPATDTTYTQRLDRNNLLQYRDNSGIIHQGSNLDHWNLRRAEIIAGAQQVMGPLPGDERRVPLNIDIQEETDCGDYIRQLITYTSEPGNTTPAYLLIPKQALENPDAKLPGILALHSTSHDLGHKVAVGIGGAENRDYAHALALRGCVVIAPSYPLMADYHPDLNALNYQSGTMKAIWDNIRALDLLESLPYVRRGSYGAIGHSLGGHNAIYTAIFDDRIKIIVSSCGFDSFLHYMDGNITGWTQERYMPRIASFELEKIPFDFHELIAALAPRVVFVSAPTGDDNFKWQSVDEIAHAARTIYNLHGKADNLIIRHPDCTHDFPDEVRDPAFETLLQHLN